MSTSAVVPESALAKAATILKEHSYEMSEENVRHMAVLLMAFDIFIERNKRHMGAWRVAGVQGILTDVRKKVERLWGEFVLADNEPDDLDSAFDTINYAAFLVQGVDEERRTGQRIGSWIWRKR